MAEITVIRSNRVSTTPNLPRLYRDSILSQDTAQEILYIGDMGFSWSYDQTSPIENGKPVRNLANANHGSFVVNAVGPAPTIANGGVSFSAVTSSSHYLQAPVSVTDAIQANNSNFFQVLYVKLPILEGWPSSGTNSAPILNWATTGTLSTEGDLGTIEIRTQGGTRQVMARWANAIGGTGTSVEFRNPFNPFVGAMCQLAMWRTDLGCYCSSRVNDTRYPTISGARVVHAESVIGKRAKAGILPAWGSLGVSNKLAAANQIRIYRLILGTPKPNSGWNTVEEMLEADWTLHASRFS